MTTAVDTVMDGTPIHTGDGRVCGWHIKDLPDGRCVDVMPMIYNWRICLSDRKHEFVEHAWCYFGRDEVARLKAFAAAAVWDGTGSPVGYDKQAC